MIVRTLQRGLILLCTCLFTWGVYLLFYQYFDWERSEKTLHNLAQITISHESAEDRAYQQPVNRDAYQTYEPIYRKNNDFIGWISIDGTTLDYPVMQTKDQANFYSKRDFEKQDSDYGIPYVAESCDIETSDNIIIYGHHITGQKMFGVLMGYTSKAFYEQHQTIRFDTLGEFGTYQIVAVFKTAVYTEQCFSYYRFIHAANAAEFDQYIASCKALALYDTGVTAVFGDKLITLSTCEYSEPNGRLVVVAKKIDFRNRMVEAADSLQSA